MTKLVGIVMAPGALPGYLCLCLSLYFNTEKYFVFIDTIKLEKH